jgi:S1-C subfamily serine protease
MPFLALIWLLNYGSAIVDSIPERATVWIRAGDRAVGTGWVADSKNRLIVTARHVVADRETVEVFFRHERDGRAIADRDFYLSERAELRKLGRIAIGKLVAKCDRFDLAILRADSLPPDVPALRLSTRPPQPGESCFSIGHRHDSELLWLRTDGVVRQVASSLKAISGPASVLASTPP